jgi:hypothetical protein
MTRLGKEAAIVQPADTFMGAEIWSWHQPLAIKEFQGETAKPIRVVYFCDGRDGNLGRYPTQCAHRQHQGSAVPTFWNMFQVVIPLSERRGRNLYEVAHSFA